MIFLDFSNKRSRMFPQTLGLCSFWSLAIYSMSKIYLIYIFHGWFLAMESVGFSFCYLLLGALKVKDVTPTPTSTSSLKRNQYSNNPNWSFYLSSASLAHQRSTDWGFITINHCKTPAALGFHEVPENCTRHKLYKLLHSLTPRSLTHVWFMFGGLVLPLSYSVKTKLAVKRGIVDEMRSFRCFIVPRLLWQVRKLAEVNKVFFFFPPCVGWALKQRLTLAHGGNGTHWWMVAWSCSNCWFSARWGF